MLWADIKPNLLGVWKNWTRLLSNSLVGICLPHYLTVEVACAISGLEVAYWWLRFQQGSGTTIARAGIVPWKSVDACSLWSDGLHDCSNRSSCDGLLETLESINFKRNVYFCFYLYIKLICIVRRIACLGSLRRLRVKKWRVINSTLSALVTENRSADCQVLLLVQNIGGKESLQPWYLPVYTPRDFTLSRIQWNMYLFTTMSWSYEFDDVRSNLCNHLC